MSIQKSPGGYYYVAGRGGRPGRSFERLREAQAYERKLCAESASDAIRKLDGCACAPDPDAVLEAADYLADVVEAYLQALSDGVLYAEMELRRACTAYRATRQESSE